MEMHSVESRENKEIQQQTIASNRAIAIIALYAPV